MRRRKIGKRALDWLERNLKGYEVTLTKIIPRDIEHGNDAVGEEIFYLLYVREELEKDFQKYGWDSELNYIWQRLQELDEILIVQREAIVDAFHRDYYHRERERLKMPPEYWWWYLDELEAVELPVYILEESKKNGRIAVISQDSNGARCDMNEEKLKQIYQDQKVQGCFLPWDEWEEKVKKAYAELKEVAKKGKIITYAELGIGKLGISPDWLSPKIGWILGACSEYEHTEGRPLISAIVVSKETGRPGKGFWGLSGIPSRLRLDSSAGDSEPLPQKEDARDEFWVKEVGKIYQQWQSK